MRVIRIEDPDAVGPLQVIVVAVGVVVLLGGTLPLSAPPTTELMEGAIPWSEGSLLQSLVGLLCLNYQAGTAYPDTIKNYIFGVGAAVVAVVLGIHWMAGRREGDGDSPDASPTGDGDSTRNNRASGRTKAHVSPTVSAMILVSLFLMWSFASSRWSSAPELAVGGSLLVMGWVLWAMALGVALRGRAVCILACAIIGVTGLCSLIAIWYHQGRNPGLRAMFPFGNPSLLATCLLPGVLLSCCQFASLLGSSRIGGWRRALAVVACLVVAASALWALGLSASRGPAVGLVFGLTAAAFFAVRGRAKLAVLAVAVLIAAAGWMYVGHAANEPSPTGRGATLRFRLYAWEYAWRMFLARPLTGHGQGGYALLGDSFVAEDVLGDPLVFGSRIAHAHNEWLEIMADLGAVGIVLIAGALLMTLDGAVTRLRGTLSSDRRWTLIGLAASLVALIVSECFGVGLRVAGAPTYFFTTLGLIWAMVGTGRSDLASWMTGSRVKRASFALLAVALGVMTLVVTQQDWAAARDDQRSRDALAAGRWEEAIPLAEQAVSRLDPQRALTGLMRLSDARLRVAQQLQERAVDREGRIFSGDASAGRLIELALQDVATSNEYCKGASHALKDLVLRSPGFIGSGRQEYWINLVQARNVELRTRLARAATEFGHAVEPDAFDDVGPFVGNALRAVERELLRQPFNIGLAVDFAQVADYEAQADQVIDVLARPLRHNALPGDYPRVLSALGRSPTFAAAFHRTVDESFEELGRAAPEGDIGRAVDRWLPEKLRLGAAVWVSGGRAVTAVSLLERAERAYESFSFTAPLGAAAFFAELAESRFLAFPDFPLSAMTAARRSIETAPRSGPGRELVRSVRLRLADYRLADGDEAGATDELRRAAPFGAAEEALRGLLASRYRRIGEAVVSRTPTMSDLPGPPHDPMLNRVVDWAASATKLDPSDPMAELLAARAALLGGRAVAMGDHIERALQLGAGSEAARALLTVALEWFPNDERVRRMLDDLKVGDSGSPNDSSHDP